MDNNYFGEEKKRSISNSHHENQKCSQCIVIFTSILGILSLLALIALNVANLSMILAGPKNDQKDNTLLNSIDTNTKEIKDLTVTSILPKITLINSASSLLIPSLIRESTKSIQYEIYKYCNTIPNGGTQTCDQGIPFQHSPLFSEYDPNLLMECNTRTASNVESLTPVVFDSFIPSVTTLKGCTRIPSFSLGPQTFAYTHNQIAGGCTDWSFSSQDWVIGIIESGYNNTPIFRTLQRWYFDDPINRKSCSTTVSSKGAWIICSIVTSSETDDYKNDGIMDLFIAYQDVYGRRYSWTITESEIDFDYQYVAMYPSVGSGIAVNGKIYFLVYGGLKNKIQGNARCPTELCNEQGDLQSICNKAQSPFRFGDVQILNGILTFDDQIESKPNISVRTLNPQDQIVGAEGRLYYAPYAKKYYIYVRSSSWYPFPQFGEINLLTDLRVKWSNYTSVTRPGGGSCGSTRRCPRDCLTGVYTDIYLLSSKDGLAATVELIGDTQRRGPTIKLIDINKQYLQYIITTTTQSAAYTTTTCFLFNHKPWCISIVEMSPATIGSMAPVSFMYPIWSSCSTKYVGQSLNDLEPPSNNIFT
nr:MAG: attachment glycoprotein [Jeilongvirus miniopteri]